MSLCQKCGLCEKLNYKWHMEISEWSPTIYDRIDAAATINFSTQFGAATIRERRLFRSAQVQAEKNS